MKKSFIILLLIITSCNKNIVPEVKLLTTKKHQVIFRYKKNLSIEIPFLIKVKNKSFYDRNLSFYQYRNIKKTESSGVLYKINNNKVNNDKMIIEDNIKANSTQSYILYTRHKLSIVNYDLLQKKYHEELDNLIKKDSLPIGTLTELKKTYPKLIEDILKGDLVYFSFPKLVKGKGYADGVRVPVTY